MHTAYTNVSHHDNHELLTFLMWLKSSNILFYLLFYFLGHHHISFERVVKYHWMRNFPFKNGAHSSPPSMQQQRQRKIIYIYFSQKNKSLCFTNGKRKYASISSYVPYNCWHEKMKMKSKIRNKEKYGRHTYYNHISNAHLFSKSNVNQFQLLSTKAYILASLRRCDDIQNAQCSFETRRERKTRKKNEKTIKLRK